MAFAIELRKFVAGNEIFFSVTALGNDRGTLNEMLVSNVVIVPVD